MQLSEHLSDDDSTVNQDLLPKNASTHQISDKDLSEHSDKPVPVNLLLKRTLLSDSRKTTSKVSIL